MFGLHTSEDDIYMYTAHSLLINPALVSWMSQEEIKEKQQINKKAKNCYYTYYNKERVCLLEVGVVDN